MSVVPGAEDLLARLSESLTGSGVTVAVAESLTAGQIATQLGMAKSSSEWFAGGVIAYRNNVKYDVLGVDRGPVVTARAAEQMATGVARITGADAAVAVSGVGGPTTEEGKPAGTVFIGACQGTRSLSVEHHFDGGPEDVLAATTLRALEFLEDLVRRA